MRRIYKRMYLRLPTMLLPLVGMLILVACYNDEGIDTMSLKQEPVSVYLHVSADALGDLNSTRATDLYAESGEFMNTLCVFVVNASGTIEAKFGPEILEGYTAADTGDLTDWTSDKLTLTPGNKTIYAFANWNYMESEEWETLIAKEVGDDISDADLSFTIDDPAGKVDVTNGRYIPMSGRATASISLDNDLNYNPELIEVGMDRLVGKVTIVVDGETSVQDGDGNEEAQNVTLGNFTFSGWADKVPMMSDDSATYEYAYNKGYEETLEQTIVVDATSVPIASFYVNETSRPATYGGFDITLEADRYGGIAYTATTARTEIPRNYIYPIHLTLDQNVLDIDVRAWTAGIGTEEVPYYNISVEGNTWNITLLDVTTMFQFTPVMYYKGTEVSTAWTWTYLNANDDEAAVSVDDDGVLTAIDLTAINGYEYQFTLVANWTTSEGTSRSRTYNVNVTFTTGRPSFAKTKSTWSLSSIGGEWLNMIMQNNRL